MAITQPNFVALDLVRQSRRSTLHEETIAREIQTCRRWFLTRGETARCLGLLAEYVTVTGSACFGDQSAQLRQLVLAEVQRQLELWLNETPPEELSLPELQQFYRIRIRVAESTLYWATLWKDFGTGERGEMRRCLAARIVAAAEAALKMHRQRLDKSGSQHSVPEVVEQGRPADLSTAAD